MPVNQIIPIYIVAGFLDSGKTTLIHNMIDDESFSRGQKTLLVVCEDGEEEYDAEKLAKQKVTLHMVDSVEDMTPSLFVNLNKQYKPERVIIEYNNTFTFAKLDTMQLPPKWELVQVIDMVDATTFDSYMNNMRQLMTDPMQNADLILFNRCENDMNVSAWRRQLRAMNSTTTILFEYNDANSCTESRAMSWKPGQGRDAKEHPLAANPKRAFPASKGAAPPRVKTAAFQR